MARHTSVAIKGDDLLGRVFDDDDTPWHKVLGVNNDRLDELERLDEPSGDEEAERERIDERLRSGVSEAWFVVSWPEHVINPAYNGDANYQQCRSREEAVKSADCVYGD